ncbi:MAG TPA: hypothetical protein HA230_04660 [Candidatus Aenigmarchaeota archaeon]|nr:hypothetical protein [Candidatus Aenigmarchaeota archaeon]
MGSVVNRKIKRKCLVCGKSITITLRGTRYTNGNYFELIGKEKIEYWECNNCFEASDDDIPYGPVA